MHLKEKFRLGDVLYGKDVYGKTQSDVRCVFRDNFDCNCHVLWIFYDFSTECSEIPRIPRIVWAVRHETLDHLLIQKPGGHSHDLIFTIV